MYATYIYILYYIIDKFLDMLSNDLASECKLLISF